MDKILAWYNSLDPATRKKAREQFNSLWFRNLTAGDPEGRSDEFFWRQVMADPRYQATPPSKAERALTSRTELSKADIQTVLNMFTAYPGLDRVYATLPPELSVEWAKRLVAIAPTFIKVGPPTNANPRGTVENLIPTDSSGRYIATEQGELATDELFRWAVTDEGQEKLLKGLEGAPYEFGLAPVPKGTWADGTPKYVVGDINQNLQPNVRYVRLPSEVDVRTEQGRQDLQLSVLRGDITPRDAWGPGSAWETWQHGQADEATAQAAQASLRQPLPQEQQRLLENAQKLGIDVGTAETQLLQARAQSVYGDARSGVNIMGSIISGLSQQIQTARQNQLRNLGQNFAENIPDLYGQFSGTRDFSDKRPGTMSSEDYARAQSIVNARQDVVRSGGTVGELTPTNQALYGQFIEESQAPPDPYVEFGSWLQGSKEGKEAVSNWMFGQMRENPETFAQYQKEGGAATSSWQGWLESRPEVQAAYKTEQQQRFVSKRYGARNAAPFSRWLVY